MVANVNFRGLEFAIYLIVIVLAPTFDDIVREHEVAEMDLLNIPTIE